MTRVRPCEICKISPQNHCKGRLMARFPKNEKVCKKWVRNVGVEDLAYIPIEKLCAVKYLCERHFKPKHFTKNRRKLKKKAVPLLNLALKPLSEEVMRDFPLHVQKTDKHHEDHSYCFKTASKLLQSSTINSTSGPMEEAPCSPKAVTPEHTQNQLKDHLTRAEPHFKENWQLRKPPDSSSDYYGSNTEFDTKQNSYHISSQEQRLSFHESDPYNSDNETSKADITIPLCDPLRSPEQRLFIDESKPYNSENVLSKADVTIRLCDPLSSPEQRLFIDETKPYNSENVLSKADITIPLCDPLSIPEQRLIIDESKPYNSENVLSKADITIPLCDPLSIPEQRLFIDESKPYNSENVLSKADITIPLCDPLSIPEQRLIIDESKPYNSENVLSKADITIPLCDPLSSPEQRLSFDESIPCNTKNVKTDTKKPLCDPISSPDQSVSFDDSVSYNSDNVTSEEDLIILICDPISSDKHRLLYDESVPYNLNNVTNKADITIPLFDPEKHETLQWLSKIEQLAALHDWTDDMKSYLMQSRLFGKAKVWHVSLQDYDKTWSQWKELLLEAFPPKIDYVELLRKMLSRQKLPTENLTEYYNSKVDMLNGLEIYGDKAVACIIDGLPPYMKPQARAGNYMNPKELYSKFLSRILFVV